jgi:acyl-[acyl-carrier-protein] desaturase
LRFFPKQASRNHAGLVVNPLFPSMFEQKLPVRFHFPEIVKGPWTPDARQHALDQDVLGHYIEYFGRAMKFRNWSPWHNLPLEEMGQWGSRLSQETAHLIEGFLGVEEYVGDYVLEGLEMFRHDRTRRNLQLQWGAEEARHGISWELVLNSTQVSTVRSGAVRTRWCRSGQRTLIIRK